MSALLAWMVMAPLISAFLIGCLYLYGLKKRPLKRLWFTIPALMAPTISFAIAVYFFVALLQGSDPFLYRPFMWLSIDTYDIYMGFLGDKLSIFMALFITFVGGLIHVYATAYMHDDTGYGKFFAYFNLFLASMLLLVLAEGPLIMFIGWEGVGLCSYLLISFYFQEPLNVFAGNKAFIVNRVGDMGFLIGLALLYFYCGDYGFDYASIEAKMATVPSWVLPLVGLALFVGAMGKSAQIPLYVWLPDAMAGPTPVSALIHAATMVTAGVYMVTRFSFLYEYIPDIGLFIAYVGAMSALFAAIIATQQRDIKKILAYSTMSQLGYMFMAAGVGAYSTALFHVFTHAFFKALLFMGAGAVIVALHHEQNIFRMKGMRRQLPIVYVSMLIATLSISGIPPFAGFFSKDEVLLEVFKSGHYVLWAMGVVSAVVTAYYMFRLFFIVFENPLEHHTHALHPVGWVLQIPLAILALGVVCVGFLGFPELLGGSHAIGAWLSQWGTRGLHISHTSEWLLLGVNIIASFMGISIAYWLFVFKRRVEEPTTQGWIYNTFYVDLLYDTLFVQSTKRLSHFFSVSVDTLIVDKIVMSLAKGFVRTGRWLVYVQNGNVRFYASVMMVGMGAMAAYLLMIVG